jgi:diphosphate-dependent phosphofructokinase
VLSGGQAPGGHNVIAGLYDMIKLIHKESRLFGFLNGPKGVFTNKYVEVNSSLMDLYRNQGGFDMICNIYIQITFFYFFPLPLMSVSLV